jgi:hypothetical protein
MKDMQDTEFTVQDGRLFMLQTRNGKRTGVAALRWLGGGRAGSAGWECGSCAAAAGVCAPSSASMPGKMIIPACPSDIPTAIP